MPQQVTGKRNEREVRVGMKRSENLVILNDESGQADI